MDKQPDNEVWRRRLRYRVGDRVRIIRGPDRGRTGTIIQVNPASARPYLVTCSDTWYVHFAEDRLAHALVVT